jgi:hypothetical protein
MVRAGFLAGCFAFLALTGTAAAEQRAPGSGGLVLKPLVQPHSLQAAPSAPATRYSTTYSEQVAQRLGVGQGGLELAQPGNGLYAPSISFNGSMLRLQWRP